MADFPFALPVRVDIAPWPRVCAKIVDASGAEICRTYAEGDEARAHAIALALNSFPALDGIRDYLSNRVEFHNDHEASKLLKALPAQARPVGEGNRE
jgi:hypothetical protein